MAHSPLDVAPRFRPAFAAAYLTVQLALVATSYARPDHAFGFQMFNESSTVSIALFRRLRAAPNGELVRVPNDGVWQAHDRAGALHTLRWNDRVRDRVLGRLGRTLHASYGASAQLFRLQAALDDFAAHGGEDAETLALVAEMEVHRNGHQVFTRRLESAAFP